MMKKTVWALSLGLGLSMATAQASEVDGCQQKKQNIEQQISQAKAKNNTQRLAGLEKALAEVKANCTPKRLYQDAQQEVRAAQAEVAEREQDLKKVQADGRRDKIQKREAKLAEARAELAEAERALARAAKDL